MGRDGRYLILGVVAACGGGAAPEDPDAQVPVPTFHGDVAPILNARCQSCHVADGIAPFALLTYQEAVDAAPFLREAVLTGIMPPWGANPSDDCTPALPWKNQLSLDADEIETLVRWVDGGTPEGVPPAEPLVPPAPVALSRVDVEAGFAVPYPVSGSRDLSRCFPLDVQLPAGTWVQGFNVVPGNRRVVHHVNVFSDPTRNSLILRQADGTIPCDGYPGFEEKEGLGIWLPGAHPVELPDDFGIYLPDGSSLLVEVHYHPIGAVELDDTHVQLKVTDVAPRWAVLPGVSVSTFDPGTVLLPGEADPPTGPEFLIPAGAAGHVETIELTIPSINPGTGRPIPKVHVLGLNSHMHLLGKEARVEITHPTATGCVLHEDFDYRWQRFYEYDAVLDDLPTVEPGDVVQVRCTYDNTLDNQALADALAEVGLDEPIDVRAGWRTLDEMCQATLSIAYEWTGEPF